MTQIFNAGIAAIASIYLLTLLIRPAFGAGAEPGAMGSLMSEEDISVCRGNCDNTVRESQVDFCLRGCIYHHYTFLAYQVQDHYRTALKHINYQCKLICHTANGGKAARLNCCLGCDQMNLAQLRRSHRKPQPPPLRIPAGHPAADSADSADSPDLSREQIMALADRIVLELRERRSREAEEEDDRDYVEITATLPSQDESNAAGGELLMGADGGVGGGQLDAQLKFVSFGLDAAKMGLVLCLMAFVTFCALYVWYEWLEKRTRVQGRERDDQDRLIRA